MKNKITAALAGSALLVAPYAAAVDYSFDTTLSYGLQWRVADRDDSLVGKANLNPATALMTPEQFIAAPGAFSVNGDAGNLNYDDGDLISNAAKITSEFSMRGDTFGFFARGFYFYDFENVDHPGLSPAARRRVGERGDILDAFVYGDWNIGESQRPFSLRAGKQVVNWGESTFIQGGINVINPIDVSVLRVPGAELRDALLPVMALWSSIGVSENVSMELFWQAQWKPIKIDPPGTYFSTANFVGAGGNEVVLGFGQFTRDQAFANGAVVARAPSVTPDDGGEYGAALRWFSPRFDTEFGFFALNYHSRLPVLSGIAVTGASPSTGRYYTEYPEDIKLYGISFNTVMAGWAMQGEYSYRPNQPLQFDDVELLFGALSPLNAVLPHSHFLSQLGTFAPGANVQGYERHKVGQAQVTATYLFGQNNPFRASNMVFLTELAVTHVYDLPDRSVLRYEGPGTSTGGGADRTTGDLRNPLTQRGGFADATSWGYRMAARVDYNSVFGAWNMSPRLAFAHDVSGTSPGPGGNFIEGRKSISAGLNFLRLEKFAVDVSYTNYFGGGAFNLISDRDFAAIDFKYSF
ncbi:MAG: DUF1302 domain-containing protein [Xanthomonadaceae bacterium]|nr:DUF1302 domain-containing protein [Xanthomonadaceae bacterium]